MKLHDDGCQLKGNVSDVEDLCKNYQMECILWVENWDNATFITFGCSLS